MKSCQNRMSQYCVTLEQTLLNHLFCARCATHKTIFPEGISAARHDSNQKTAASLRHLKGDKNKNIPCLLERTIFKSNRILLKFEELNDWFSVSRKMIDNKTKCKFPVKLQGQQLRQASLQNDTNRGYIVETEINKHSRAQMIEGFYVSKAQKGPYIAVNLPFLRQINIPLNCCFLKSHY